MLRRGFESAFKLKTVSQCRRKYQLNNSLGSDTVEKMGLPGRLWNSAMEGESFFAGGEQQGRVRQMDCVPSKKPPQPVERPTEPSLAASLWLLRSGRLRGAACWKLICSLILTQHPAQHKLFREMINKGAGSLGVWAGEKAVWTVFSHPSTKVQLGITVE